MTKLTPKAEDLSTLTRFRDECETLLAYSSIECNDSRSWDWEIKRLADGKGYEVTAKFGINDEGDDMELGEVKYHIPPYGKTGIIDAWVRKETGDWISVDALAKELEVEISEELTITALLHNYLAGYDGADMTKDSPEI